MSYEDILVSICNRTALSGVSKDGLAYLVPVFLHAAFGSGRESLVRVSVFFLIRLLPPLILFSPPLRFHSSCSRHPSSASAAALRPASMACSFALSSELAAATASHPAPSILLLLPKPTTRLLARTLAWLKVLELMDLELLAVPTTVVFLK
jgi:hypothetical protein